MNLNPITIKKGIVFLVILGLALGFAFPALAGSLEKGNQNKEIVPKIDSEAAFIVREKNAEKEMDNAKFPEKFWIFLFGAYLFLLVFNLSLGLKRKSSGFGNCFSRFSPCGLGKNWIPIRLMAGFITVS
jgi:hypothetical protein